MSTAATKRPRRRRAARLLDAFERMDDQVPVTEAEAKEVLAEAGIDSVASLQRLRERLNRLEQVAVAARPVLKRALRHRPEGLSNTNLREALERLDALKGK